MPVTIGSCCSLPVQCKLPLACVFSFCSIILLLLNSEPVYAEWESFGISEPGKGTAYIDRTTIRREGNLVKMRQLLNFDTAITQDDGKTYRSIVGQYEYDCAEERWRSLALTSFSGPMGEGKMVWDSPDALKWEPIPPRSLAQRVWVFLCGNQ